MDNKSKDIWDKITKNPLYILVAIIGAAASIIALLHDFSPIVTEPDLMPNVSEIQPNPFPNEPFWVGTDKIKRLANGRVLISLSQFRSPELNKNDFLQTMLISMTIDEKVINMFYGIPQKGKRKAFNFNGTYFLDFVEYDSRNDKAKLVIVKRD